MPNDNYNTLYRDYVKEIHDKLVIEKKLDWVRVFCGREGMGGKSTNAIATALLVNPDFDPETQVIYDMKSFLCYLDTYENKPGHVAIFDEAVLSLLGAEAMGYDAKSFQKLFTTHRDLNQEYYLCIPSPWRLMPYMREDRVSDCVIGLMDVDDQNFDRQFAYYSRWKYSEWIVNKRARDAMLVPSKFVKTYKPDLGGNFTLSPSILEKVTEIYSKVFQMKKDAQRALRGDIRAHMDASDGGEGVSVKEQVEVKRGRLLVPAVDRLKGSKLFSGTIEQACSIVGISKPAYYNFKNASIASSTTVAEPPRISKK